MMADHASLVDALRGAIRTVPDWPQPGVQFRDITPVLGDGTLFAAVVDLPELGGSSRLRAAGFAVRTLLEYPGH